MKIKNKEALLNEYKGYLFEYLVASELIRTQNLKPIESQINESHQKILAQQETYIRNQFPNLLKKLPVLASSTSSEIINKFPTIEGVELVGKVNNSLAAEHFTESDIDLETKHGKVGISLKLAKFGLPTNTKSSGVLSFFSKYFRNEILQLQLNNFIDLKYDEMARDLHEIYEVQYDPQFKNWASFGLPLLPGELNEGASRRLKKYYYELAEFVYIHLKSLLAESSTWKMLLPLAGFSEVNIIQVICFYSQNYELNSVSLYQNESDLTLKSTSLSKSTILLDLDQFELHLRIKPMNRFTSKAFKINNAIKFKQPA